MGNGYINFYVNNAYRTDSGEQAIQIKGGDEAFSSGKESDLGEHHYVAINDLQAATNKSLSSGL